MTNNVKDEEAIKVLKRKIEEILKKYNTRKEDLQWADEEWEIEEIQEELDGYANEIKKLKAKIHKISK
jgi:prefoldin subunit 5